MATLQQLLANTNRLTPEVLKKGRSGPGMEVIDYKRYPFKGTKMLKITAIVRSENDPTAYTVLLEFHGLNEPEFSIPNADSTPARVRCSCMMFYIWYAYWDHKEKAISGVAPRPYVRVPDYLRKRAAGPPKNPNGVPGVCKHLVRLIVAMKQNGQLIGRSV